MKKKIVVSGPCLSRSGYGEMCRFALKALKSKEDIVDLYVLLTNWGNTGNILDTSEEVAWIHQTAIKTQQYLQATNNQPNFDTSIQITIPNEWKKLAAVNIGYTAGIETNFISPAWLQPSMQMDKIIVISEHAKSGFENTIFQDENRNMMKVSTPVSVCHFPVKNFKGANLNIDFKYNFNFLSVCQWGPRKNLEEAIVNFVQEFMYEEVGLVLKVNTTNDSIMDKEITEKRLAALMSQFPRDRKCVVHLLHGHLKEEEMNSLYRHPKIKAVVSSTHGEGFGFPLFEATYNELPVIVTDWSGHLDFLTLDDKKLFAKVDYELKPIADEHVWQGVLEKGTSWAYPLPNSFKSKMREVYKDYGRFKSWAKKLNTWIRSEFTEEKMYDKFFYSLGMFNKPKQTQVKKVDGISFCISTNAKKLDKTNKAIKSIINTAKNANFENYEINIAGVVNSFEKTEKINLISAEHEANSGMLAKLRNIAAQNIKYENIVFLDDDIIFEDDWIEKFVEYSNKNSWDVLGNKILLPNGDRYWDRAIIKPHTMVSYEHPETDKLLYQTGCFWVIRKNVYENFKWDDSIEYYAQENGKLNEDVELSRRLTEAGYCLSFDENNTVWHLDGRYIEKNVAQGIKVCLRQEVESTFCIKDFSYLE